MASHAAVHIGTEHQLFLDDYIIDRTDNIHRSLNRSVKCGENPVLKPEGHPWEVNAYLYGSVLGDLAQGYKMWYFSRSSDYQTSFVSYAVSPDGVKWEKPLRDIVRYQGRLTSAVLGPPLSGKMHEPYSVIRDESEPDEERKYKMLFVNIDKSAKSIYREQLLQKYAGYWAELKERGFHDLAAKYARKFEEITNIGTLTLGSATSRDGIRWNHVEPRAVKDVWDISHLTYDPYQKRYLIYGRDFHIPEDVHLKYRKEEWYEGLFWGRAVQCLESKDFVNWSPGKLVLSVDTRDDPCDEIYSMAVFPYEGMYIGLVQMFHAHPDKRILDIQLAVSRDGERWTRAGNREAFISLGGIGEWDRFHHSIASAPVAAGEELRFYYSSRMYRHTRRTQYRGNDWGPEASSIGFSSIKRDRFIGMCAAFDGGIVVTKPLIFSGTQLHINAKCDFGTIKISLLDERDDPIEGFETTEALMKILLILG